MKVVGKTIVITSGKGGVGKTTCTANLGAALALSGKTVVLIDGDIGLRNLDLVMGLENRIVFDIVDVVEKKCRSYRQATIKDKRFDGLFLLPAAQSREKDAVSPPQMKALCEELKGAFDYVLIDSPAGIEQGFKNAVAGADEAIVVTNAEVSAIRDADRIVGLLEAQGMDGSRLIINRFKPALARRGQMLSIEDVQEILGIELLGIIPEDEAILKASNKGEPAVLNRASAAGTAYLQMARRLLDPSTPPPTLPESSGWLARLGRLLTVNIGSTGAH